MKKSLAVFMCLLLLAAVGAVIAQEEVLSGELTASSPVDTYTITLNAGETITLTVEATSPTFDPILELYDPNGVLVASNDDIDTAGGNYNSRIIYTVTTSGDHSAVVTGYGQSVGTFNIRLVFGMGAGQPVAPTPPPVQQPGSGTTFTGSISDLTPAQNFTVTLNEGERYNVTATAVSGDLDTLLNIYDSTGRLLGTNDDIDTAGGNYNSLIDFVVPATGTYTIQVTRYSGYASSGSFVLALEPRESVSAPVSTAEGEQYSGAISNSASAVRYEVSFLAGESAFITAVARSGDLDTVLTIYDQTGRILAQNDDFNPRASLNSAVSFTAPAAGIYIVEVSRYQGAAGTSTGTFTLTITRGTTSAPPGTEPEIGEPPIGVISPGTGVEAEQLSGPVEYFNTANFRIHFTQSGGDRATMDYVREVARAFEEAAAIQFGELGFARPPLMSTSEGLYDVYLIDLLGKGESALGYAYPAEQVGDNPNTPVREGYAYAGYMVVENDFDGATSTPEEAISLMRATVTHEFNHLVQFGYDALEPNRWVYEATSTWIEINTFTSDEDASSYLSSTFEYPEICIGVYQNDPAGGLLRYGTWLYLQSLSELYGKRFVSEWWDELVELEDFYGLTAVLNRYNDDIPNSARRYHVQNLLRDYSVAAVIQPTVYLENLINGTGKWEPRGPGVQELGANYFEFAAPPGRYMISLSSQSPLQMWAVGISDGRADVIPMEQQGAINTQNYDFAYLMIYNPMYDDNPEDCVFASYSLTVEPTDSTQTARLEERSAASFIPPN